MDLKNLNQYHDTFIVALRWSLGIIFLWFGLLKAFGYNPVADIVEASFPFLAYGLGSTLLGIFEAMIGLGLITNLFPTIVHVILVLHLLGTFSVFFSAPELMFSPYFPVLTLAGEFVFKNITLVVAGLVVMSYNKKGSN